ncbi:MAG: polyamine aminopropyltransferase [Aquificae bacterium]|nr:polyamine aminopropyltransferase [Aquificota bacterium]
MSVSFSLKVAVLLTGFSGLVAEYLLATLATYLLGNALLQWSVVIALFLLFMGVGSRLSRYVPDELLPQAFVVAEIFLSLLVSFSPLIAYTFGNTPWNLQSLLYLLCSAIGTLVGLEIPLVLRLNNRFESLKENISSVLEKDYLGSLPAGLLYAHFFLPVLGLVHTALLAGTLNLLAAFFFSYSFFKRSFFRFLPLPFLLLLGAYGFIGERLFLEAEQRFYGEKIVFFKQSPYQKIVLTRWGEEYYLYLDGHLQFSSPDERRYHEALVHIPASFLERFGSVLILGGGDGLALREVLKYPFREITLVELDPAMIEFSRSHPVMRRLNEDSLLDPRVRVVFGDAFEYVMKSKERYDLVVIDLVDPRTPSSARLYTYEFYRKIFSLLREGGVMVTQAGDFFFKRKVFCSILKTVKEAGFFALPYRAYVPSLGEWGFVMGIKGKRVLRQALREGFREELTSYLTRELALSSFLMPKDFKCDGVRVSTLLRPSVLDYYYLK